MAPTVLTFEARPYDDPDVVRMVADVQAEYVVLYGGPDAAAVDPEEFAAPGGCFLVGLRDGTAVATGAWRRLPPTVVGGAADVAEIKRMYTAAAFRGHGIARAMLAEVERTAAGAGVQQLVLNTGPQQPAAIALYESAGYTPVPPFGHYADTPNAVFLGKRLADA